MPPTQLPQSLQLPLPPLRPLPQHQSRQQPLLLSPPRLQLPQLRPLLPQPQPQLQSPQLPQSSPQPQPPRQWAKISTPVLLQLLRLQSSPLPRRPPPLLPRFQL